MTSYLKIHQSSIRLWPPKIYAPRSQTTWVWYWVFIEHLMVKILSGFTALEEALSCSQKPGGLFWATFSPSIIQILSNILLPSKCPKCWFIQNALWISQFSMHRTWPNHLILLDLITQVISYLVMGKNSSSVLLIHFFGVHTSWTAIPSVVGKKAITQTLS